MENIITVHFAAGQTQAVAPGALYQWAYGQTLKIEGLQLPTAYQVDFSNFEFCGSSIPRIGGADGVTVPAEVLATGQPVFAFIWLQNQNAGRTWYRIMIRVIPRPAPDPDEPNPEEESAIAEAIAALNAGVTAAETAQEKAEDAQDAAEAAQEAAEDAAELLEHPGAEAHTLSAGSSATASYENGIFSFGIPKGDKGDTGATGPQGPIGLTPALSIGTVNTLAAGSPATASFTGTDAAPVLNLGIPKGADGDVSSASIAPTFSPSTAYSAGDYVWYSGALYRFTAAHAAGAWSGSDAVAVQLAEDVGDLKSATSVLEDIAIEHPTANYLKADVRSGDLQANGSYSVNSSAFGVGYKIPLSPNGKIKITPFVPEGLKYAIRFVTFAEEETIGTLTQTPSLTEESYTFTQPATKTYLMFSLYYRHSDGTAYNDILDEFSDTDVLIKTEIITEILPLAHMEDVANAQAQIDGQEEALEFDHSYLNIVQGASTFEDNKFINDRGVTVSNPNFCLIDGFYPVKPNTTYKLYRGEPSLYSNAGHNWTWWDNNKSFISYVLSGNAVTSPPNAAYLRFGVYISSTGSVTHADFNPSKVIITEDALPCFDDIFVTTPARPTFNGLKWIGVGDSITEVNFRATYHYWDYIVAETGLDFVNMGVSGTGYKAEGSGDKAFYKRVPSMATDADVITIFGGVNDVVLSNADIGTETDTGTTTICGCVNTTLDAIETLYPAHMPIGIISPLPCACVDTTVNLHPLQNPNDDTCRMALFVEQLALICKHRGIPFLDLFHQSNLRPWHQECNAKYFSCDSAKTGDGLHPNGHGHRLFYRHIMDFVQKIVMQ